MKRRDQDIEAEMRFHIEMEAAELERKGLSAEEARRKALASFGGVQRYKEEARGASWREDLARDLRYSVRSLLRSRGYAAVVILTLALGIAANTSIFSVANGILFKPLPYRDPSRLVVIWDGLDRIGVPEAWVTGPEVIRLRREMKTLEGVAAMRSGSVTLGGSDGSDPQQLQAASVSANFFQVLGAGPDIGRGFVEGEDREGAPRVAVISRGLWKQRFGADTSILGKSITIDGGPVTIAGILPQTFRFSAQSSLGAPYGSDIYLPLPDTLARMNPSNHSIGVLARVRPNISVSAALAELAELGKRIDAEIYGGQGFKFAPVMLQERMVRDVRPALKALLAAVAMLIVIMCANLAVLALARASRRDREITVRRAIGASSTRISRQILTETLVLALASAVAGALLGSWALRGLLAMAPPGLPRREEIGIDFVVLAVTLGVALLVGLGMALAPVFHSLRSDISTVLREKSPSRTGSRVRHALVLAQLSLSMVLLAGTALLLGSFVRLMRVDAGFSSANVLTIDLMAPRARYAAGQPVVDLFVRYADAIRALPGVTAVGATSATPLSAGMDQSGIFFPSSPTNTGARENDRMLGDVAPASDGYFKAMGIQVIEGREFATSDRDSAARIAVIDEKVSKRYFPRGGALGQVITIDGDSSLVVGVVRHVRMYGLHYDEGRGQIYVPHAIQQYRFMTIAVRTRGDPLAMAPAVRQAIRSIDAAQPIANISTMDEAMKASLAERRLVLTLVSAFAGAALLLAALGVYGVTSSSVTQRTRELGIRMALGADRRRVIWSVLGGPARLVSVGLALGLAGTVAARRVLERLLYDVSPTDPMTLGAVAIVLFIVALLASYLPARRATKVDPMLALRAE